MGIVKKPLKRSILTAIIIFIAALCIVLSVNQYLSYRDTLYREYQEYIENILHYTASGIDHEDLKECIRTGVESEKYHALQGFLNQIRENISLHFLYIVIPVSIEPTDNIINVIAATTAYEREHGADGRISLNMPSGDSYPPAAAKQYLDAYESGELSFFREVSQRGEDYTGLLPLYGRDGKRYAALCMDVDIQDIQAGLRTHTITVASIVLFLGLLFSIAFLVWAEVNITHPLKLLERSVVKYASRTHKVKDPASLVLHIPDFHTDNEVESLAVAIRKMSEDMRKYHTSMTQTGEELARMTIMSHKDGLTHVGSKIAFSNYLDDLNRKLSEGGLEFAILIVDTNGLKAINDTYGHDRGDLCLKKCCELICDVYKRSPVFRIEGDVFAAILVGRDFEDRDGLYGKIRKEFQALQSIENAQPWEKVSVAIGMAVYAGEMDKNAEEVLERARRNTQAEKKGMRLIKQ